MVARLKAGALAEPVLVGRECEFEELQSFLALVLEGKGKTVFVSGEAGCGKTRLVREFLNTARKQGVAVMAGWCLSDAQVPYFPFMEAFNNYYAASAEGETSLLQPQAQLGLGTPSRVGIEGGEREITSWLAGQKPADKAGLLSPQAWKDQVFAAVSEMLHTIAVQGRVVLFIDDIHWADSASLALLHYVARAINNSERILVLATFRSEELTTDAEGHAHPLAETMRIMRREELFSEIKLSKLSQDSISKIAESMIGGSLQKDLAGKLTAESGGNPLFVVESLRMLHERKSLVQENNEWRLSVDGLGIPNKIKDIILRRLACLNFAQRRILDAASVIGEKFDVELLSTVLGIESLEVLETLNQIAHSTSLVRVEENRYRFDHARSRETLYEELSAPLKRGYHNKIAEKLENTKTLAPVLSDLAYHYAQAGNSEKAVKFALAAGKDELEKYSNTQAIRHFQYVIQKLREGHSENKEAALEGLGDAYYASSMFKDATGTFEKLADVAEPGVVKLRALRKAMQSAFDQGDTCHLTELVKKTEPFATADRLENARVLRWRGRLGQFQGERQFEYGGFIRYVEDALQVFEEEYSLWDVASVLTSLGNTYVKIGRWQEGFAECLRSIALFDELGDFHMQMNALYIAGFAFGGSVLIPEALDMYAKIIAIDEKFKMGDYLLECYAYVWSANFFARLGNLEKELSYLLRALELSEKTDSLVAQGVVYSSLAKHYARIGDVKNAEQYFEKLVRLPKEIFNYSPVNGELTKAVFMAAKGQWRDFEELHDKFKASPTYYDPAWLPYVEWYYVWILEKQGRLNEAQTQLEQINKIRRESEERFARFSLQSSLMVRREVKVGEKFEMRLDMVNVSRRAGHLVIVEAGIPSDGFTITSSDSNFNPQDGGLQMKGTDIGAFQVVTYKLSLQAKKVGTFTIDSKVIYTDELGENKFCKLDPVVVTVKPAEPLSALVAGRVSSGFGELDNLLMGGLPENYAVALVASSGDERQFLIKRFLEVGTGSGETTLYMTGEAGNIKDLAAQLSPNLALLVCSPQSDLITQNFPNVYNLKGVDNLTDIDISLTKYLRALNTESLSRRACVDLISDVLLQHHAVVTRKWLAGMLANLKLKGFTILGVVDPDMHPSEEVNAILSLFDGEINMFERETAKGLQQVLRIRKLLNQQYLENELTLTKER